MSPDEGKRAYRREMLLATALVAGGLAMSGVSLARIVAGNAHVAQVTPPLPSSPAPAPSSSVPAQPGASAEKTAPPVEQK